MRKHECRVQVKGTKNDFTVSKSHYEVNKGHLEIVAKEVTDSGDEKMATPATKNKMASKPKATK